MDYFALPRNSKADDGIRRQRGSLDPAAAAAISTAQMVENGTSQFCDDFRSAVP